MKKGFTLIEILVVATIITLLAAAGAVSYTSLNRSSRDARRKADLEEIRTAIEQWRSDKGTYPGDAGDPTVELRVDCSDQSLIDTVPNPDNVYLQKVPKDPRCTATTYYYDRISDNDYTLGTALETGGANCNGDPSCDGDVSGSEICNYCVGPYGQR